MDTDKTTPKVQGVDKVIAQRRIEYERAHPKQEAPEAAESTEQAGMVVGESIAVEYECPKCGRRGVEKSKYKDCCVDCAAAEKARYNVAHRANTGWQEEAAELGLNLWDRQPNETNWEYMVWSTYMGMYPFRKPTLAAVAKELSCEIGAVKGIAARWDFAVRLQAYIAHCDAEMQRQRTDAMIQMNQEYIDAAEALRHKLREAVDMVNPVALAAKPSDLVAVAKLADDMERRARIDAGTRINELATLNGGGDSEQAKKRLTKKDDLGEVVKILMESGALGSITQIGVRETTTRETVLVDNNGNASKMTQGDSDD